ncbi:Uridine nucleosidase 1 [Ciborinia camelliae]|nr:Uridine nucleosidase 1 [Ciborinia camelliae]
MGSHDDAFAILLSVYHPSLNLLGISTVHGNSSINHTTYNATSLLTSMSATHIPVYRGSGAGLVRPGVHAPAIHGESGLEGTELLPTPAKGPVDEPAIDAMAKALFATPKDSTWVVATGALTNIALCFRKYEGLAEHIKGLSIMGGAVGNGFTNAVLGRVDHKERIGNWSIWAEFNILVDPEAAAFIFEHQVLKRKAVLIPLDITHQVLATKEVQDMLGGGKEGKGKSTLRTMLVELLTFFAATYDRVFGMSDGPPLHDPLAVAVIMDGIMGAEIPFYDFKDGGKRERFEVKVITEGTHDDAQNGSETGRTIIKLLPDGEEGVKIPRGLDIKRFWETVEDCLSRADAANKANGMV